MSGSSPDDIREKGWFVAVHNDYVINAGRMTFWLFTHPESGRFVKGEGPTDEQALDLVRSRIDGRANKNCVPGLGETPSRGGAKGV